MGRWILSAHRGKNLHSTKTGMVFKFDGSAAQFIRDAAVAMAISSFVIFGFLTNPSSANPWPLNQSLHPSPSETLATKAIVDDADRPVIAIPTVASTSSPNAVYKRTSVTAALVLLAAGLSLAAAFNLAVLRHFRRAYANPRKT